MIFSETKPGGFTSQVSNYPKIHCAETNAELIQKFANAFPYVNKSEDSPT